MLHSQKKKLEAVGKQLGQGVSQGIGRESQEPEKAKERKCHKRVRKENIHNLKIAGKWEGMYNKAIELVREKYNKALDITILYQQTRRKYKGIITPSPQLWEACQSLKYIQNKKQHQSKHRKITWHRGRGCQKLPKLWSITYYLATQSVVCGPAILTSPGDGYVRNAVSWDSSRTCWTRIYILITSPHDLDVYTSLRSLGSTIRIELRG